MGRRIPWQLAAPIALLVLLAVLGTLQYRWLGDVSQAERERMRAAMQTRVSDFTEAFDREVTRTWVAFQVPLGASDADSAPALADAYARWASATTVPGLVTGVYLVEARGGAVASARRLDVEHRTLAPAELPPAFTSWASRLSHAVPGGPPAGLMLPGSIEPSTPALVTAAPRIEEMTGGDRRFAFVPAGGPARFVVVTLDRERLRRDLLAPLAAHYFDREAGADYAVTIVARDDPATPLFELPEGAAVSAGSADLSAGLFDVRLDQVGPLRAAANAAGVMSREHLSITIVRRGGKDDSRVTFGDGTGGVWQVRVRGRAGSLEALVQRSRRRNLAIGFGVLLLLGASFALVLAAAERQRRLARQQIEFVASVSHELRTPLAVICSAGENLADGVVAEPDQVKRYGALVGTEGRRLADMVERIMTFAGIASGAAARPSADVDVAGVIGDAVAAVAAEARERGVEVRVALAARLPHVSGDAAALRSALQNIVGNAVKYSADRAVVDVAAEADERVLRIRVSDRGLGIDAGDLPHVFKPFFRGRRAVDAQVRGTGIGLSVVRHVVDAHDGRVRVDSRPGAGTTVTIELPVAARADAVLQSSPAPHTPA